MANKHKYTILTPTHNRAKLLPRVYKSIKEQTYKNFIWLVINDHSTDNTLKVLEDFEKEKVIDMHILNNPHPIGGKHTVLKYAFEVCETPYLVDIDDDDELFPNALEVFNAEWDKIIDTRIGSIRALTIDEKGKIVGNMDPKNPFETFDASFLDIFYLTNLKLENITCFKVQAVRDADIFPDTYYLKGHERFLTESIFWGRLARKYTSRYISIPLRTYHYSSVSILRHTKSRQHYVDLLISNKLQFEEHYDYLKRSPKKYLLNIGMISILVSALEFNYKDFLDNIKYGKKWFFLFYPIGRLGAWLLFRKHGKYL